MLSNRCSDAIKHDFLFASDFVHFQMELLEKGIVRVTPVTGVLGPVLGVGAA